MASKDDDMDLEKARNIPIEDEGLGPARAKPVKRGLGSASYGIARGAGWLVGGSYRMASSFTRRVRQCGQTIAGIHGQQNMPDTQQTLELENNALRDDLKKFNMQAEEGRQLNTLLSEQVPALEKQLVSARSELKVLPGRADEGRQILSSEVEDLKKENEHLRSELEKSWSQANKTNHENSMLSQRINTFKTELAGTQAGSEQAKSPGVTSTPQQTSAPKSREDTPESEDVPVPESSQDTPQVFLDTPPTANEIEAAVFNVSTHKVIFIRAVRDLASLDNTIRLDGASALGHIPHELSVRALVSHLQKESTSMVRAEAINALAKLGMEQAKLAVEKALSDSDPTVRLAAVRGVYGVGGKDTGELLIRMFADEDEGVRRRAVVCLGWLGNPALAPALEDLLGDTSVSVCQATIEALATLRTVR